MIPDRAIRFAAIEIGGMRTQFRDYGKDERPVIAVSKGNFPDPGEQRVKN